MPHETILAAIDSSAVSDAVVNEAAALARATGARLCLFSVVQLPVFPAEYAPLLENIADLTAAGEKAAAARLQKIQQRWQAEGLRVEVAQAAGAPVAKIIEQAAEIGADCIVMGSHGHNAVHDLLVGSTTHGVLRRAQCPLMIVPPKNRQG